MSTLALRLVPDDLWELWGPLVPMYPGRRQGGGTAPLDDRAVFTAIVYVLTSGCTWRRLPTEFGVSTSTAHRRFLYWTGQGLWNRLHQAVLDELGQAGPVEWSSAIMDAATGRAVSGPR